MGHILTGAGGAGVLALPRSIAYLGWVGGPVCHLFIAYVTQHTAGLMAACHHAGGVRQRTLTDLARAVFGRRGYAALAVVQQINLALTALAYHISAATALQSLAGSVCRQHGVVRCFDTYWKWCLIFMGVQFLVIQLPDLNYFAWASIFGATMTLGYSFIAFVLSVAQGQHHGTVRGIPLDPGAKSFGVLSAFGSIMFAYSFGFIIIEIMDTIRDTPALAANRGGAWARRGLPGERDEPAAAGATGGDMAPAAAAPAAAQPARPAPPSTEVELTCDKRSRAGGAAGASDPASDPAADLDVDADVPGVAVAGASPRAGNGVHEPRRARIRRIGPGGLAAMAAARLRAALWAPFSAPARTPPRETALESILDPSALRVVEAAADHGEVLHAASPEGRDLRAAGVDGRGRRLVDVEAPGTPGLDASKEGGAGRGIAGAEGVATRGLAGSAGAARGLSLGPCADPCRNERPPGSATPAKGVVDADARPGGDAAARSPSSPPHLDARPSAVLSGALAWRLSGAGGANPPSAGTVWGDDGAAAGGEQDAASPGRAFPPPLSSPEAAAPGAYVAATMGRAITYSVLIMTVAYLAVSVAGYMAFGSAVPENILQGFSTPSWVVNLSLAMVVAQMVPAYQVYSQPFLAFMEALYASRAWAPGRGLPFRIVGRTVYVGILGFLAICLPFFGDIIGLVGAIGFWPSTVLFPIECWIRLYRPGRALRVYLRTLSVICCLTTVGAIVGSIQLIVVDSKGYQLFSS